MHGVGIYEWLSNVKSHYYRQERELFQSKLPARDICMLLIA